VVLFENELDPELLGRPVGETATHAATVALEHHDVGGAQLRILESCHSLWIFDPARMRFRRAPRGARLDMPSPESEWAPYYRLEIDASTGAFAVGLTPDDTRVLRSRLHIEPCRHCAPAGRDEPDRTAELSLDAIRRNLGPDPAPGA
jgi:hypothetical protein